MTERYLARTDNRIPVAPWNVMDRMIDRMFNGNWPLSMSAEMPDFLNGKEPDLDMYREGDQLHVDLDLPGVNPTDIHTRVFKDHIELKAEKKHEEEKKEREMFRSERYYGSYCRTIGLPSEIDPTSLEATYKDGILHFTAKIHHPENEGRDVKISQ